MQVARTAIRISRSSSTSTFNATSSLLENATTKRVGGRPAHLVLGIVSMSRVFSQAAAAAASPSSGLGKEDATNRVLGLLKSIPFVDPVKVSPTVSFKDDLQLDTLDNVEVMMAVEEEFAVDIPNSEAGKILTTAQLIDYITAYSHTK